MMTMKLKQMIRWKLIMLSYEVALGTDLTEEETRTNIHGFVDVGLATTYTFHDLNLTAVTTTYYVTVRAYSAAGSFSEGSSDGIKAGFSGKIKKVRGSSLIRDRLGGVLVWRLPLEWKVCVGEGRGVSLTAFSCRATYR